MSEYHKQTTTFNDEECLVKALVDIGYSREQIEVHKDAVALVDYVGRQTHYTDSNGDKANVIIRRQHLGYRAGNDVGFKWNVETKSYDAMISEYDSSAAHWGAEGSRFKKLKTQYSEHRSMKQAKKMGFRFLGKKVVNGKVQLQFVDPRVG